MTTSRHTTRKRFPRWLRELVEEGKVSGVYWLDNEKTTFRVPWTRVDSPEFDLFRDAMLFQKWAEFTGRFRVGERTDPSVWKTRFRCAIRKMTEIEELKMENNLDDTRGQQPFRVFRFKKEAANRPKRKEAFKRKYKCRGIVKSRNNAPLVYGQYHCSRSREIKQGVVLAQGVTRSVTQTLTRGETESTALTVYNRVSPDFMSRGVTQSDGMTHDGPTQHCVTQNEALNLTNCVRPDVTSQYVTNNNTSVTHSSSHYGIPDMSLQKVLIGFAPSSHDTNYFPNSAMDYSNFETNSKQYAASNTMYRSDDMATNDTFINTPWQNPMGVDRTQAAAISTELLSGSPSNLPRISLQDINSILLACSEPLHVSEGGEFTSVPRTASGCAVQSPLEADSSNKCNSNQFFDEHDCQEMKAYNNSLILSDLNEIFQQSIN